MNLFLTLYLQKLSEEELFYGEKAKAYGFNESDVVYVDENGAVYNRGINVKTDDMGFLPVVNIKSN